LCNDTAVNTKLIQLSYHQLTGRNVTSHILQLSITTLNRTMPMENQHADYVTPYCLTRHDFLLADAASLGGVQGQTGNGDGQRHLLVAGNGGAGNAEAALALRVDERASVTFRLDTDAAEGEEAGCGRLAAALQVAAANAGLKCLSPKEAGFVSNLPCENRGVTVHRQGMGSLTFPLHPPQSPSA
jgi:hypothetical protein